MPNLNKYFMIVVFLFASCSTPPLAQQGSNQAEKLTSAVSIPANISPEWKTTLDQTQNADLVILHFNDVYEITPVNKGLQGGASRVQSILNSFPKNKSLIFFSGDAFGGGSLSRIFQGRQMVDAFNKLGVTAAVIGNHEFDYGKDVAEASFVRSRFPWLAANLKKSDGTNFKNVHPWIVADFNGKKIAIMGLVSDWRQASRGTHNAQYTDYITTAKTVIQDIKSKHKGIDLWIALTHMHEPDDKKLAEAVPELDLILSGHDHKKFTYQTQNTTIIESGADWDQIGVVSVKFETAAPQVLYSFIPVNPSIPEDPAMKKIVKTYVKEAKKLGDKAIAELKVKIDVRRNTVRTQEAAIGNAVADSLLNYVRNISKQSIDFAVTNGGGLRTDAIVPAGPFTINDAKRLLPFPNAVIGLTLKGKDVVKLLEHGVSKIDEFGGSFLQVSGIEFTFDPKQSKGSRVVASSIKVSGNPLDLEKSYSFATNDFLANGGDDFDVLKTAPRFYEIKDDNPITIQEIFIEHLQALPEFAPKVEGRIKAVAKN